MPDFPANTTLLDAFTGTSGDINSSTWPDVLTSGDDYPQYSSNQVFNSGNGDFASAYHVDDHGPDVDFYIFWPTKGASNDYIEIWCCAQDEGTANVDGYSVDVVPDTSGAGDNWELYEITNGSYFEHDSAEQELSNGNAVGIRREGNLVEGYYYNGTSWNQTPIVAVTDATHSTGKVGFAIQDQVWRGDNASGGTVSGAATLTQDGFRWRNDDGSESSATWIAGEDTNIAGRGKLVNTRLRVQLDAANDPDTFQYRLEYRRKRSGEQDPWRVVTT